ncbi:MAG TPA: methyltransferase [Phycisphaerae bacterium]|nr:methyltransferase [Phycisphaerae bacterium]
MKTAEELKEDIVFDVRLRGRDYRFHSTWGLFSPRRIDDGTYMLIETLELADDHVSLDLGCGYGAIGVAVAAECPRGQVHMVDKDFVAVEYARKNADARGLTNCQAYLSNAFSHVPDVKFDNVLSNVPANVGGEMLYIILSGAKAHLAPGGRLVVVTVAGLRQYIKRNFLEVFGNYEKVKQGKTYAVARAVNE